jgi:DNA-directed RNA polymerase beta' subunit
MRQLTSREEGLFPRTAGLPRQNADIPIAYKKFVANLQASGINVVPQGDNLNIMALRDSDVLKLAGDREVKSGETLDAGKQYTPIAGGLFDPKIFGDDGRRWGYVQLQEPIVNPVMEDPVRRTLGLTKKQLDEVISGKLELPRYGGTGPAAIGRALGNINLPSEIAHTRQEARRRRGSGRDDAVRRLGYLLGAQKNGLHPKDWMLSRVPVLPPVFRQVGMLGDTRIPLVPDSNLLYRDLFEANDNLKSLSGHVSDLGQERLALYNSYKAVTGLGDPVSKKLQEKKVTGILGRLFGSSPKMGTVQRRLLSQSVDLVGRSVISPNPDLDMDSIEIPEESAWSLYRNFIARRLRRRGMPVSEALRNVEDRTPLAREEMINEMSERPVIATRAPVLQ